MPPPAKTHAVPSSRRAAPHVRPPRGVETPPPTDNDPTCRFACRGRRPRRPALASPRWGRCRAQRDGEGGVRGQFPPFIYHPAPDPACRATLAVARCGASRRRPLQTMIRHFVLLVGADALGGPPGAAFRRALGSTIGLVVFLVGAIHESPVYTAVFGCELKRPAKQTPTLFLSAGPPLTFARRGGVGSVFLHQERIASLPRGFSLFHGSPQHIDDRQKLFHKSPFFRAT